MEGDLSELYTTLNYLGFSEVETSVYTAFLKLGGARPASVVAKKAGLKRGHTYNILSSLQEKGLVQELIKNGIRHFTCSPPDAFLSIVEHRQKELDQKKNKLLSMLPLLESLQSDLNGSPQVRFYQGMEGIKEIFEDKLRTGEDIFGVMDIRCSYSITNKKLIQQDWHSNFIERRAEMGLWYYGIIPRSGLADEAVYVQPNLKREIRVIDELELPAEINVYGNKVSIISTHREAVGVVIESQAVADTLKCLHQRVWPFLSPYPNTREKNTSDDGNAPEQFAAAA